MARNAMAIGPAEVTEMRAWLGDCSWQDLGAADFAGLSEDQVVDGVRRFYSGGVEQFLADVGVAHIDD